MSYTKKTSVNGTDAISVTSEHIDDLDLIQTNPGEYHAVIDGQSYSVNVLSIDYGNRVIALEVNGSTYHLKIKGSTEQMIEEMGFNAVDTSAEGSVKAPMPGLVLKVMVSEGQEIQEGDHLCILEAMKMENVLKSPATGTLTTISVSDGTSVNKGDILMEIEAS